MKRNESRLYLKVVLIWTMFCGKVLILLSAAFNLNLADGWHMTRKQGEFDGWTHCKQLIDGLWIQKGVFDKKTGCSFWWIRHPTCVRNVYCQSLLDGMSFWWWPIKEQWSRPAEPPSFEFQSEEILFPRSRGSRSGGGDMPSLRVGLSA